MNYPENYHFVTQGTEEWKALRTGKITASRCSDIMAKTKSGPSASRGNATVEIAIERLTGKKEETFQTQAMIVGIQLEAEARALYEALTGVFVEEVGFIDHASIGGFGASPDGLVWFDGGIGGVEIKCPQPSQHLRTVLHGEIKSDYHWQMAAQMACGNLAWVDFVSYNPDFPEKTRMKIIRVMRDEQKINELENEVKSVLAEVEKIVEEIKGVQ